jgi:hypothetical protein
MSCCVTSSSSQQQHQQTLQRCLTLLTLPGWWHRLLLGLQSLQGWICLESLSQGSSRMLLLLLLLP